MPEHDETLGVLRAGGSPGEGLLLSRHGTLHLSRSRSPTTFDLVTYSSMDPTSNLEVITSSATHHNEAEPDERVGIDVAISDSARKEYISVLLRSQLFNGSFLFGSQAEAEATLGSEVVVAALRGLTDGRLPDAVLYIAAVVVLLERDFGSCQALWDLMHDKALAYVQNYRWLLPPQSRWLSCYHPRSDASHDMPSCYSY